MESIWSQTCTLSERQPLDGHLDTDIVIIGAGMTGILTAYKLQRAGLRVTVLESGRIASGQTRSTTAKITSQHGFCYHRLLETVGQEKAAAYGKANEFAIQEYERIISLHRISCDFEKISAYLYSDQRELLLLETEAASLLGLPASFTEHISLPLPAAGAVRFQDQAQFHPLKFIRALADSLTIYEHSQVTDVKDHTVYTENGSVTAKTIIFTCHYPFLKLAGLYSARMHQERSYVLALEHALQTDGMYIGEGEYTYSFRNYKIFFYSEAKAIAPEKIPTERVMPLSAGRHGNSFPKAAKSPAGPHRTASHVTISPLSASMHRVILTGMWQQVSKMGDDIRYDCRHTSVRCIDRKRKSSQRAFPALQIFHGFRFRVCL